MYPIDYNSYRSVKSFNRRVRFLIMHYTSQNFKDSINTLTGNRPDHLVSAHYLVPDPSEQTYIDAGFKELRIFNLVEENERAWHAGVSWWSDRTNINDNSIGIEIVNEANDGPFLPFNQKQIEAVAELSKNILQRYPDITPVNVVGHSDIAPGRKSDPGAAFPWKELYQAGIGAWPDADTVEEYRAKFTSQGLPERSAVINLLNKYGYSTKTANTDNGFKQLIRAFQLHFRQAKYDGELDVETAAILAALCEKYKKIKS
ncbi:N-acetylmuramoyl-L-alanine amidase [Arsenophonus sp.]|uniref:N-acetylmuramoyl-L-alanine amidase n=1 Tax=Arsenophonus sp. TaxID=1872640 RepID=UPI00387A2A86